MSGKEIVPLVSIGVATYNRPAEIRKTLEQLTAQTYSNLEIIVSDNGSENKDVFQIIESFANVDSRVRPYRQSKNLGPVANFQFVLDQATGDYFMWSADDDWHHPDFVQATLNQLINNPEAAIAFCDFQERNAKGVRCHQYSDHLPYLEPFAKPDRLVRLWHYFMQDERLGKANLIYGLMRRESLHGFSLVLFVKKYGFTWSDVLFVYHFLLKGSIVIEPKLLYSPTVGNTKHYEAKTQKLGSNLFSAWHRRWKRWIYYFTYVRMTPGWLKVVPLLGMIVRILRPRRYRMNINV